jgi:hypothetical protein
MVDKDENQEQNQNEDGQDSIETFGIGEAEDGRGPAKANAASAVHHSRRPAEEAYAACAPSLRFGDGCTRWQAQRGVSLGEDERDRIRSKLPRIWW